MTKSIGQLRLSTHGWKPIAGKPEPLSLVEERRAIFPAANDLRRKPRRIIAKGRRSRADYSVSADTVLVARLYLMLILLISHRSTFSQVTSASLSANTTLRS